MLGDIKISLQPGFSSLMQDLARQPLDDANARPAAPAAPATPTSAITQDMPAGTFIPTMLPLPSNTMQRVAEPDRRSRNLADVRAAFQAFDEPTDEPVTRHAGIARAHDADRAESPGTATPTQQDARPATPLIQEPRAAPAKGTPAPAQTGHQRAGVSSVRNPMVDSLQASLAAAPSRRPASSQPILLMFVSAVVSIAVAWLVMRFV